MITYLLEALGLAEEKTQSYSISWWGDDPPPQSDFAILGSVLYDLVSLLWTTNLGIITSVSVILAVVACFLTFLVTHLIKYRQWLEDKKVKTSSKLDLKSDKWTTAHGPYRKHHLRKRMKNPKKDGMWKTVIKESTETEQEMETDNYASLHKYKHGFNRKKKKQRNATAFDKSDFKEYKGTLNEKPIRESSNEIPSCDHHRCHCCKDTSAFFFRRNMEDNSQPYIDKY
ncbi:uncharacterized protein LOC119977237 [Scyliorhinus canicula]|uniref:uncharacterized protein LOC119977237 n=1 Tax=Scyliorhinus canicula TaxID=7830 RepID=UPI0018F5D941|nr:uncharacterized protein LOC119977237 [Scyliorhinus canicula]